MGSHHHRAPRSTLWRWPLALGTFTSVGLVTALLSDGGFGDFVSWLTLGFVCLVTAWHGWVKYWFKR